MARPSRQLRRRHRSRTVRPVAVLACVAAVAALGSAPATAAAPAYVALGDSYSSGTGTRSYISDGTTCQRSVYAYPALVAAARSYALSFRACSGAKVSDVQNLQLSALGAGTAYVTISVGGNDAGFADVLTECAQPAWMSDCHGAIDDAQAFIGTVLPGRLSTLYGQIRTRAPGATVVVAGYPRIFNGEDCNAGTWFSPSEMSRLNQTADLLNQRTQQQAAARGFAFGNPTGRFLGHAVCDDREWINGLSWPITESYHPNRAGHASGYTPTVSPLLTGASVTVSPTVRARAAAMSERLASVQRRYAERDAAITPATVRAPDLSAAEARAAARSAGVDLRSRATIDLADRIWSRRQARAWREGR